MMHSYRSVFIFNRLSKEYEQLRKSPPSGVVISLPSDTDLYTWEAIVDGPKDSFYEGK